MYNVPMSETAARILFGLLISMALASCGESPASPTAVVAATPSTATPATSPTATYTPAPSPTATHTPMPTPTLTAVHTPTPAPMHIPTQTPTATPTPAPTPTPMPRLTPIATPALGYQVVTRNQEYAYDIDAPEGWTLEHGEYKNTEEEQGRLVIISEELADGITLERFAQSVRDGLREDWGPDASRFEITNFERTNVGGRDAYSIAYRVRESADSADAPIFEDAAEIVLVASSPLGDPQGFRARYALDNRVIWRYGAARTRVLDSFRILAE